MKFIRLTLTFYQSFAIFSIVITIACASIFYTWGIGSLSILVWFKFATLAFTFYSINSSKDDYLIYFTNLGLSKRKIWIAAFSFDMLLFILFTLVALKLR